MLNIAVNKAHYERGQIFPFLIAVVVVILIAAMITVNLGQIGIFKTDVSNAADAAALAAASTLSSYLLGFGLKSDYMCGFATAALAMSIILFFAGGGFPVGLVLAIINNVIAMVKAFTEYFEAFSEGKMAWSNAKKTALQYAFQNAGIDAPKPSFRQFLTGVYGINTEQKLNAISSEDMARYYRVYSVGDDPGNPGLRGLIRQYTQSGFSRFMEEQWYWRDWEWGKIEPGEFSPAHIYTGYGWNDDGTDVYNDGAIPQKDAYKNYDNYVEVDIVGNVFYPLDIYNPLADVIDNLRARIAENIEFGWPFNWLENLLEFVINLILGLVAGVMKTLFPAGLEMDPIKQNTDNNPIIVTVRRHKRDKNLGLWDFRYGTVESQAIAHAYGDTGNEDIKPAVFNMDTLLNSLFFWGGRQNDDETYEHIYDYFDTRQHLFETEVTFAR